MSVGYEEEFVEPISGGRYAADDGFPLVSVRLHSRLFCFPPMSVMTAGKGRRNEVRPHLARNGMMQGGQVDS